MDHPDGGSKDLSDAVCGSLYNASKHADEFSFFYGEDIENTISASSYNTVLTKKQIELDMEAELNRMLDPLKDVVENKVKEDILSINNRLGGNATAPSAIYLNQGILI